MSIAWRAILVASLAAGEEATLASLTGLFQREPDRAAALVAEVVRAEHVDEEPAEKHLHVLRPSSVWLGGRGVSDEADRRAQPGCTSRSGPRHPRPRGRGLGGRDA